MTAISDRPNESPEWLARLTQIALVILLTVVALRATIGELNNDAFGLGGAADPGGPGTTTTVLLNLLCLLPALLVLVRRAIDATYVLRWQISHWLLLAVAFWITASAFWASNKFDALVGASTWWAATALLWAASQLCRSWTRLRPILGVAAGLLLVFVAQSLVYRLYEGPELVYYWNNDPDLIAKRAAEPDSFIIRQMAQSVTNGTQQGFFRSPNSYAAITVLCGLITAGFVVQHLLSLRASAKENKDANALSILAAVVLGLPLIGVPLVVLWTGSRTAGATAVLAAIALAVAWPLRQTLAARSRTFYWIGAVIVLLGIGVVVAIGLKTGGLIQDSLNFRWNYWVASWHMVLNKPWLGVGWANFGDAYLAYRLPVAAEEIKDPHNVFVHFVTETGLIGLGLAVAWIGRLLWEITRPIQPKQAAAAPQPWVPTAILVALLFWVGRMALLWPLTLTPSELSKTALFGLLLLVGLLLSSVRDMKHAAADDRPAPFLVYAVVTGLLAFLLHNNVDFSIFETGPLMVFALVVGGLLGVRQPGVAGKSTHTLAAIAGLGVAFITLLAVAGLWAVPVMLAESKAAAAEDKGRAASESMRTGRQELAASQLRDAVSLYREAMEASPVANPAYPMHAVRFMVNTPPNDVLSMLTMAALADPADPQSYLQRARYGRMTNGSKESVIEDYAACVARNPNDTSIRVEYADVLDAAGQHAQAVEQLKAALAVNNAMHADEPRRLPADKVKAIEARLK